MTFRTGGDAVAHGVGRRLCGLVRMPGWPPANYVALGQVLPLSELRFLGLQMEEWHWPLRAIVSCSGKCPAQAGVEKMMAVSISGEQVYVGLGLQATDFCSFLTPALPLGAVEPQANHTVRILIPSAGGQFCPGVLSTPKEGFSEMSKSVQLQGLSVINSRWNY